MNYIAQLHCITENRLFVAGELITAARAPSTVARRIRIKFKSESESPFGRIWLAGSQRNRPKTARAAQLLPLQFAAEAAAERERPKVLGSMRFHVPRRM